MSYPSRSVPAERLGCSVQPEGYDILFNRNRDAISNDERRPKILHVINHVGKDQPRRFDPMSVEQIANCFVSEQPFSEKSETREKWLGMRKAVTSLVEAVLRELGFKIEAVEIPDLDLSLRPAGI